MGTVTLGTIGRVRLEGMLGEKAICSVAVVPSGWLKRIYDDAAMRLGWAGTNPPMLLLSSERPKPSKAARKRLFEGVKQRSPQRLVV